MNVATTIDKDVVGLEVTVNNPCAMGCGQAARSLSEDTDDLAVGSTKR